MYPIAMGDDRAFEHSGVAGASPGGRDGRAAAWLVDVAVDGARLTDTPSLTYAVPERWAGRIGLGQLVWVPLRKKLVLGVVVGEAGTVPPGAFGQVRPLHAPVEPSFQVAPLDLRLGAWLARESASTLYAALAPFLPPGVTTRAVEYLRLVAPVDAEGMAALTPTQRALVRLLTERGERSVEDARKDLDRSLVTVIDKLEVAGVIERVVRVTHRAPVEARDRLVRLAAGAEAAGATLDRAPSQHRVVAFLEQRARLRPEGRATLVPVRDLLRQTGTDAGIVRALIDRGLLEEVRQPRRVVPTAGTAGAPELTAEQAAAWAAVEVALRESNSTPFLLHGVTGSGKTEVYLRAVAWCLRHDRGAIVLVPEIGLASQVVRRFQDRFPGEVAVLHSALPDAERYATWGRIRDGEIRVVVGPRSALFAPVAGLGLIVLDEEHDGAYKQESEPRYHARRVAEEIAARHVAVLVLGSATPAVETFHTTAAGTATRLVLSERVGSSLRSAGGDRSPVALELPPVEIVDMRLELHRGQTSQISGRLAETIEATLAREDQTILFLNRRGLATVVLCRACGDRVICPHCDVALVYHQDRQRLLCHRCGWQEPPPDRCRSCGGGLNYFGAGTQRIEEEVRHRFPGSRVLRWDQDAVRRGGGHERLLKLVERREVDIVVGTQMIAKGLDLPRVTAVGVIHADTMLHLPDFRSGERTFQMLTQVAGRAGRRAAGSTVIVQSFTPDHYAIQAAARHDYDRFYAEEIDFRQVHRFPPFTRLIRYLFRDADEATCATRAEEMARRLARHARSRGLEGQVDLLGPTPAFASRVRGRYQWQIVLRATDIDPLLDDLPAGPGWTVDIDPQNLL